MSNYSAINPFKYNEENATKIFETLIGDLNLLPFGDIKNELTYNEVQFLSNAFWYLKS